MELLSILIFLPIAAAFLFLLTPYKKFHYLIVILLAAGIGFVSVDLYMQKHFFSINLPPLSEPFLLVLDSVLLLFFMVQGMRYKNIWVFCLALLQLLVYIFIEWRFEPSLQAPIAVDALSLFMLLIINGVGTVIIFYAVAYMDRESISAMKKRTFTALLMLFLPIMDGIVVADDMMLFFFLFEMTTLASYLLIRFRGDSQAQEHALSALWMNQIGGLAILVAAFIAYENFMTGSFVQLLQKENGSLPLVIAFLSMAALVKGASIPFDRWLIGAMVAPTPVSAMLHSATMVKIAPFMIVKFSSVLAGTVLGTVVMGVGSMVFVAASYMALSKTVLKEILGHSTIALLGLMMAIAALGTKESATLVLILIAFHALSKALLFLAAGTAEKLYEAKSVEAMEGLSFRAPQLIFLIILGFSSLSLPPFGLFMGKLFAIQMLSERLAEHPFEVLLLLGLLLGSALMVVIYFKITSALLSRDSDLIKRPKEILSPGFFIPMYLLAAILFIISLGMVFELKDGALLSLLIPIAMMIGLPLLVRFLKTFDRSRPYHCAEESRFKSAPFYLGLNALSKRLVYLFFTLMFISVALSGVIS